MPPFEALPFWLQVILFISSVLVLGLGGRIVWRMVKTVFKGPE